MPESNLNLTITATDKTSGALGKVNEKLEDTGKLTKAFAIGLGAVGVGLTVFSKQATDATLQWAGGVNKLARETGESTDQTSKLIFAAKRMGLTAEEASGVFGILSKKISDNNEKTGEAVLKQQEIQNKMAGTRIEITKVSDEMKKNGDKTGELGVKLQALNIDMASYQAELKSAAGPLQQLGIATKNADGSARSFNLILNDVADKFKVMPNGAEKTALSMELFGRAGKDMVPLLNQGSEGIATLTKKAEELGLVLTPETANKIKAYSMAQKDMNDQVQALKIRVGTETLPLLAAWQGKMTDLVTSFVQAPEPIRGITTAVLAFGGPVLTATAAVIGFGANLKTAFPTMEAFKGLLQGIAGFLTNPWVIGISLAVGAIVLIVNHMGGLENVMKALAPIGQVLSGVWNTMTEAMTRVWTSITTLLQPAFQAIGAVVQAFLMPALSQLWNTFTTLLLPALQRLWDLVSPILIPVLKILGAIIGGVIVGAILALVGVLTVVVKAIEFVVLKFTGFIQKINEFMQAIWRIVPDIGKALSGASDAIINAFAKGFNWIRDNAAKAKEWLNKINPFQRSSPSLIDNIKRGSGIIISEYKHVFRSLDAMPNINHRMSGGMSLAAAPARAGGSSSAPIQTIVNIRGDAYVDNPERVEQLANRIGELQSEQIGALRNGVAA